MGDTNTEGVDRAAPADPLVGRRLASYEVLSRVARGGMGVVYRARHVYIDKVVALKVLDPALAGREDLIERFRTEAQSLARVEHDNVVKVIDILEDRGVHFIVMDFAEGTNLRNRVRSNGPMGGEELLSVARQTAEALFAAHRQGILHRDIKPENLIMNARGRCKLADFGLAGDMRLISEGHEGPLNFGTPAYSAPEVLRRMVPDKRSDIFSYGATLFFLATGEPPFGQTDIRSVMLRQRQGAELLDTRRPDLPQKLSGLIMDCIAYHPKDRPDGFREVMDRLPARYFARPVGDTPTAPTEPLGMDSGTHETPDLAGSRRVAVAAAVLAALAVALVAILWLWPGEATVDEGDPGRDGEVSPDDDDPGPPDEVPPDDVDGGDVDPAFGPEDEAFSSAQLEGGTALSNADYRRAFAAWDGFLRSHPESEYADEARRRRDDVARRVDELRAKAFENTATAVDAAIEDSRTAEAMGAIDRFPEELLVPLSDADDVEVADRLETRRRVVEAADAQDLASLMQEADRLREEWNTARTGNTLSEVRRMRGAGNLLEERELLEAFLPGRLKETQERVEARLKTVRKLLESAHQAAMAPVSSWRQFHDETLGEWAAEAAGLVGTLEPQLRRREFDSAIEKLDEFIEELGARHEAAAQAAQDERVRNRIQQSEFVEGLVSDIAEDVRLARSAVTSLESALRIERRGNNVREYLVHDGRDAAGELSARLERYTGRVVSVDDDEFAVLADGVRRTVKLEFLSAGTVRKLIRAHGDFDDQLRLVAWLVAQGRDADAAVESDRLSGMDGVPADVRERGRELSAAMHLAPLALRRLAYTAARTGLEEAGRTEFPGGEPLEAQLADAQSGVLAGDVQAARTYADLVNAIVDPEMADLATFQRALELADPTENDARMWVLLEPLNPEAHATLADVLLARGDRVQARQAAGKALLLDPSNERAFRIRGD